MTPEALARQRVRYKIESAIGRFAVHAVTSVRIDGKPTYAVWDRDGPSPIKVTGNITHKQATLDANEMRANAIIEAMESSGWTFTP